VQAGARFRPPAERTAPGRWGWDHLDVATRVPVVGGEQVGEALARRDQCRDIADVAPLHERAVAEIPGVEREQRPRFAPQREVPLTPVVAELAAGVDLGMQHDRRQAAPQRPQRQQLDLRQAIGDVERLLGVALGQALCEPRAHVDPRGGAARERPRRRRAVPAVVGPAGREGGDPDVRPLREAIEELGAPAVDEELELDVTVGEAEQRLAGHRRDTAAVHRGGAHPGHAQAVTAQARAARGMPWARRLEAGRCTDSSRDVHTISTRSGLVSEPQFLEHARLRGDFGRA